MVRNNLASLKIPELTDGDRVRWLGKVWRGPETDCWIWTGARNPLGYGRFYVSGLKSNALAHRVGYVMFRGPLRPGSVLMHECDNNSCVNPEHMRVGTSKKNTWDMIGKGRHRGSVPVLAKCPF